MMNPYYYLYYRLYKFAKKVSKWEDSAWLAVVWIAVLSYFNIATVVFQIFPVKSIVIFFSVDYGFTDKCTLDDDELFYFSV